MTYYWLCSEVVDIKKNQFIEWKRSSQSLTVSLITIYTKIKLIKKSI